MAFDDEILTGFGEASDFMAEAFTLSNHVGTFRGVFRGEQSPVDHSGLEGYDTDTTDALSASKAQFTQPPMVNETLTKSTGERYVITMVENGDASAWDMELTRVDV